tara:strand:- start:4368 stop:4946 length:579 start_codon:yes stop_codon:yes gene_type:complete
LFKRFNKNITSYTDAELIAAYQRKPNPALIGELFERYSHLVFGMCMKYLKDPEKAQDEVSSIFEKLLVDLKKHSIDNFKSWLYMVARNHCLMILRQEKSREHKPKEAVELWQHYETAEEKAEKDIREEHLKNAIQQLNKEQRMCIELFYLHEKSYREIEELTSLTNKQVKSYIQNGKRNLKIILSKNEPSLR